MIKKTVSLGRWNKRKKYICISDTFFNIFPANEIFIYRYILRLDMSWRRYMSHVSQVSFKIYYVASTSNLFIDVELSSVVRDSDFSMIFISQKNENSRFDFFKFIEKFRYLEKNQIMYICNNFITIEYCRLLYYFYFSIFFSDIIHLYM